MVIRPYLLHALSPLHAGTGQAVGVIDLPIARMQSTGIPIVPGSSIKGVLRDAREHRLSDEDPTKQEMHAVFGPPALQEGNNEYAGALMVSDARLLALPIRSFLGTFAWVTSPLLLQLAQRDLQTIKCPKGIPSFDKQERAAKVANIEACDNVYQDKKKMYLEDLDLNVTADESVAEWSAFLAPHVAGGESEAMFRSRFVVLDDETMSFLWETATQIDTRIRLDPKTRTTVKGALWTEESLPPESLLVGILTGEQSRKRDTRLTAEEVLKRALKDTSYLQFGGKATVGRGRCRISSMEIK